MNSSFFRPNSAQRLRSFSFVVLLSLLGCGGAVAPADGSNGPADAAAQTDAATPPLYAITGAATGLDGSSVTLLNNGTTAIDVPGDGPFSFPREFVDGAPYVITILKEPAGHMCSLEHEIGHVAGADVTGVVVNCRSSDASLVALSLSGAPLSPTFAPSTLSYTAVATMPLLSTGLITLIPTARDPGAQITVAGTPVLSATPSAQIPLTLAPNPIDVSVTAADGKTQAHYTVIVTGAFRNDYLKASNSRSYSSFGTAIALSGDTLAVGARTESSNATGINGDQSDTSAFDPGAVYVFTRTAGVWSQQAYIKASNLSPGSQFGAAVALAGDTLVVGAAGESSNATGVNGNQADTSANAAGAAYVFTRSSGFWSQQAYLKASNTRARALFGVSVAVSGDTLAVGSEGESSDAKGVNGDETITSAPSAGATYIFTRAGTVWSQQAYVKASNAATGLSFGGAVAISGDTLAVGSWSESSDAAGVNGTGVLTRVPNAGAVYVFARAGVTWSQQAYVKASSPRTDAHFGAAIAVSGDTLAVASPGEASNAGAAYVFARTGVTWVQQAYLQASNPRANGAFGSSVALESDTLAVGSDGESSNATGVNGNQADVSAVSAGAAYVFTRTGVTWFQQRYVKASNTRGSGYFGTAIALGAGVLAVGSEAETSNATGVNGSQTDTSAPASGAVYVFP